MILNAVIVVTLRMTATSACYDVETTSPEKAALIVSEAIAEGYDYCDVAVEGYNSKGEFKLYSEVFLDRSGQVTE